MSQTAVEFSVVAFFLPCFEVQIFINWDSVLRAAEKRILFRKVHVKSLIKKKTTVLDYSRTAVLFFLLALVYLSIN